MKKRGQRGRSKTTQEIVEATNEILEEMAPTSIRGICYQLFNRKLIPSMGRLDTQRVSRILTFAREKGEVKWSDIVDRGRKIKHVSAWSTPESIIETALYSYRKDFWGWQPYRVIVVSEKATMEGVLEPVTRRWGVDWLAVSGFNSATRMYDLASDIYTDNREVVILYVGDWDPSGMYMSECDFPQRIKEYLVMLSGDSAPSNWTLKRIALTREDVDTGDLLSFEAEEKKTDTRYSWFVQELWRNLLGIGRHEPERSTNQSKCCDYEVCKHGGMEPHPACRECRERDHKDGPRQHEETGMT